MTVISVYLVLFFATAAVFADKVSLLEALRANDANQFADRLESNPDALAFFVSDKVKTVFAPVDKFNSSQYRLLRRDIPDDLLYQATDDANTAANSKRRKRQTSSSGTLEPVRTFLKQNTIGNQSVVPEFASLSLAPKIKIRRGGYNVPRYSEEYKPWYNAPAGHNSKWNSAATEVSQWHESTPYVSSNPVYTDLSKSASSTPFDYSKSVFTKASTEDKSTTIISYSAPAPKYSAHLTLPYSPLVSSFIEPSVVYSTPMSSPPASKFTENSHVYFTAKSPTSTPSITSKSHVYATSTSKSTLKSTSQAVTPSVAPRLRIASGLGNRVDVLKENIPYDGGVIQITSDYFTLPVSVSKSLKARGLTTFLDLIAKANLTAQLDGLTGITVFAPTNTALASASNASYTSPFDLQRLVKAHVVPGFVGFLPLLTDGLKLPTLAGTTLTVTLKNGRVFINDAEIIISNIVTENGVIQVIDKVLDAGPVLSNDGSRWRSSYTTLSLLFEVFAIILLT